MSKRAIYKNVKLEQQELESTTIGEFENRKKTSFSIFVILSIFVLVIVFLPEISELADKYLHPTTPMPNPPANIKPPVNPTPNDNDKENYGNTFYNLASDLVITRDDIVVSNLSVDAINKKLNFTVLNNTKGSIILNDLNYYLELYNSEKTLLERIKITGLENVANNFSINFEKPITQLTTDSVALLTLIKRETNEYPSVIINSNEEGNGSLVCTSDYETITYKFTNDALKELSSEIKHTTNEERYYVDYQENKNASINYNTKTGITSSFIEYNEGYTISSSVNLNEANRLYIFNADSFSLNTEPKVVKFEMEAQGFKCS